MPRWNPLKIHLTPDGRRVLFAQDPSTSHLRTEPYVEGLDLPVYQENPRYLSYHRDGRHVLRWAQVGDIVDCGKLRFGRVILDLKTSMQVLLRNGEIREFNIEDLRVVSHSIQGMQKRVNHDHLSYCLLGAETIEEVDHACRSTMAATREWLIDRSLDDPIDIDFVYELHERVFVDVFTWGGRNRTVELVVGRKDWQTPPPRELSARMRRFEILMLSTIHDLQGSTLAQIELWDGLAQLYFDLCAIHPFRDGNGRVSRLLIEAVLAKTVDSPEAFLNWNGIKRFGNQTDRAFEIARESDDLKFLATLIFRAHRKFTDARNLRKTRCPTGLREDLVGHPWAT